MLEKNRIYNMDCVEGMKQLADDTIDLTVTSPPYDNLRNYKGFSWNFEETARELYRVTKPGGVVVWVVGDATIKGSETCTSFKQALFFKETGFLLNDTMIWHKPNPVPQFLDSKRYTADFEYMFVFTKGKPKTFNPLMVKCKRPGVKHDRSKESNVVKDRGNFKGCWQRDEITTTNEYKRRSNTWEIATEGKNKGHPATFPDQLARDHILSWSNEGDLVLDPFIGSGTTAAISKETGRNYIGFDISAEYCKLAEKRVESTYQQYRIELIT